MFKAATKDLKPHKVFLTKTSKANVFETHLDKTPVGPCRVNITLDAKDFYGYIKLISTINKGSTKTYRFDRHIINTNEAIYFIVN